MAGPVIPASGFLTEAAPEGPGVGVGEVEGGWEDLAALFTSTPMRRVLAFCLLRNIKDSSQNSVYFALGLSHSLAFSLFCRWGWLST